MAESEGGGALRGLRLLTVERGPKGFGFHMYTNKVLKGQYIKSVFEDGPAELAGMLNGDHVIEVDGVDVTEMPHMKVVELIRSGSGAKKLLVIDMDTERDLAIKNEAIDRSKAIVMIPRSNATVDDEGIDGPDGGDTEEQKELDFNNMMNAIPKGGSQRKKIKKRDWKSSVAVYNDL